MGSGGTEWEADDLIDAPRMNQKTVHVGSSQPPTMYAGMFWYDSGNDIIKVRNAANDGWDIQINQSLLTTVSPTFAGLIISSSGSITLGGDVGLSRTDTNTLELATGDSFRLANNVSLWFKDADGGIGFRFHEYSDNVCYIDLGAANELYIRANDGGTNFLYLTSTYLKAPVLGFAVDIGGNSGGTGGTNLGFYRFRDTYPSGERLLEIKGIFDTDALYHWQYYFWNGSGWEKRFDFSEDGLLVIMVDDTDEGIKLWDGTHGYVHLQYAYGAADAPNSVALRMETYSSMDFKRATSTDTIIATFTGGDTYNRFLITGEGKMEWGSGAAARDTILYRSASDVLCTPDNFRVDGYSYLNTVASTTDMNKGVLLWTDVGFGLTLGYQYSTWATMLYTRSSDGIIVFAKTTTEPPTLQSHFSTLGYFDNSGNLTVTGTVKPTHLDVTSCSLSDVSGSRSMDTVYQNTSGKVRVVMCSFWSTSAARGVYVKLGSSTPPTTIVLYPHSSSTGGSDQCGDITILVPNGWYYKMETTAGTVNIETWCEMEL